MQQPHICNIATTKQHRPTMADNEPRGGRGTWPVHDQFPDIDWENVGKQVLVYGDKIALTIKPTDSFVVQCRCCGKAQACGAYIRHRISQPCPDARRPFIWGRYVSLGHANDTAHFFRNFLRNDAPSIEGWTDPQRVFVVTRNGVEYYSLHSGWTNFVWFCVDANCMCTVSFAGWTNHIARYHADATYGPWRELAPNVIEARARTAAAQPRLALSDDSDVDDSDVEMVVQEGKREETDDDDDDDAAGEEKNEEEEEEAPEAEEAEEEEAEAVAEEEEEEEETPGARTSSRGAAEALLQLRPPKAPGKRRQPPAAETTPRRSLRIRTPPGSLNASAQG